MMDNFSLSLINAQKKQAMAELRECNNLTMRFGLNLSERQIQDLVERRFSALIDTGRIEFEQGILKTLVTEFCDSPYIAQENYEDILLELQDFILLL